MNVCQMNLILDKLFCNIYLVIIESESEVILHWNIHSKNKFDIKYSIEFNYMWKRDVN